MRKFKKWFLAVTLIAVILIFISGFRHPKNNKHKVLLIGLDGASWNVMLPLIYKGQLPNIKQLMDEGCWGVMKSPGPLLSEVIWTTIATGKTLQKHGITDRLMEDPDSGIDVPPSSNLRKAKAIWNILSEKNKKAGVLNYMVTWPVEKINGVMISGRIENIAALDYHSKDRSYPFFTDLCSQNSFDDFKQLQSDILTGLGKNRFLDKNKFIDFWWMIHVQEKDNFMANFSKYLLQNRNFDFFCLYMRGIDVVSHYFWQFMFPEGFNLAQRDIRKYKDVINNYYIWCDGVIGDILKDAGKDTAVIIVSDHGFMTTPGGEYLFAKADYLLKISGLAEIKAGSHIASLKNEPEDIFSFTKNIKITGNLSKEEFRAAREKAKSTLMNIKIKETDERIFKELKDTDDGFLIKACELCLKQNSSRHIIINNREYPIMDLLIKHIYPGWHSKDAVIIISGKDIRRNKVIGSATIYDITPTVLYYMGLPVAKDMDGKVLVEAISEDYFKKNPVKYIDTYETDKKDTIRKPIRSLSDEEILKDRMRSLGYIN
jgi:predicted AlkP superfamily phosphohydrolase/phosphomutase